MEEGEEREGQQAEAGPEDEDGERLLLRADESLGADPEEEEEREAEEDSGGGDQVGNLRTPD